MPVPQLKALAKKSKKSLKDLEKYWDKAKELALEKGFEVTSKSYWPYVYGIVRQMAGVTEMKPANKIIFELEMNELFLKENKVHEKTK